MIAKLMLEEFKNMPIDERENFIVNMHQVTGHKIFYTLSITRSKKVEFRGDDTGIYSDIVNELCSNIIKLLQNHHIQIDLMDFSPSILRDTFIFDTEGWPIKFKPHIKIDQEKIHNIFNFYLTPLGYDYTIALFMLKY